MEGARRWWWRGKAIIADEKLIDKIVALVQIEILPYFVRPLVDFIGTTIRTRRCSKHNVDLSLIASPAGKRAFEVFIGVFHATIEDLHLRIIIVGRVEFAALPECHDGAALFDRRLGAP